MPKPVPDAVAVYKRDKSPFYSYQFMFRGRRIERSTKQGTLRIAQQMEAAHRTSLAKGDVGFNDKKTAPKLRDFAESFTEYIKISNGNKPETVRFYLGKLTMLLKFEPLAREHLDRIDAAEIEGYVQYRSKQVSITTVNRELATLRRMLHVTVGRCGTSMIGNSQGEAEIPPGLVEGVLPTGEVFA